MGILPLQSSTRRVRRHPRLTGEETYDFAGLKTMLDTKFANGKTLTVVATSPDGAKKSISTKVRIDTPQEIGYFEHGGILQYVLRGLVGK